MNRNVIFLVLALLILVLSFNLISHYNETITIDKAKAYVLEELENYTRAGVDVKILYANETDGRWEVKVKLSENPTDSCPRVQFRIYSVPGLSYRYDAYNVSCSSVSPPLAWPEEAQMWLVYSNHSETREFLSNYSALAYTSSIKISDIDAMKFKCSNTDCSEKERFISSLKPKNDNLWLVEWRAKNKSLFVAVDSMNGEIIGIKII